jgi:hypothetical protein
LAITNTSTQATISDGFLRLATEIVQNSLSPEEAFRTAISRAYYSVYLTVRDRLFGADEIGLTRSIKKDIKRRFKQKHGWYPGSHDRTLFALADLPTTLTTHPLTLLQQVTLLKAARVHADYHFTIGKLQDIPYDTWAVYADNMVALASQILPDAQQLPSYT